MSPIEKLKAEAVALRAKENALGRVMKHCEALEHVAKKHGYESWRACAAILASSPPLIGSAPVAQAPANTSETRHYKSAEWNFEVDIPKHWNSFPPVATNSPYEVIRFASHENGRHVLIVFRQPHDPHAPLQQLADRVELVLAKSGFGNFEHGEARVKSRPALTLTFDQPASDGTWSCRHYFVADGTLAFTLGFGTTRRLEMFELHDRIAKSFEILRE
jgi:hypothetical protein